MVNCSHALTFPRHTVWMMMRYPETHYKPARSEPVTSYWLRTHGYGEQQRMDLHVVVLRVINIRVICQIRVL